MSKFIISLNFLIRFKFLMQMGKLNINIQLKIMIKAIGKEETNNVGKTYRGYSKMIVNISIDFLCKT